MAKHQNPPYTGRFAPSPSGPLHFGSLVCALASYLHARQSNGVWRVRIEDIDPPREQPGAAAMILTTLEAHGLCWDGEILYQSTRSDAYRAALAALNDAGFIYRCCCNRKRLQQLKGRYDGHCLSHPCKAGASAGLRFNTACATAEIAFIDQVQGPKVETLQRDGDFIVHRKDGLFSYQLAVVVDDIYQNINQVVRGVDLLDCTGKQIALYNAFGEVAPNFAHIPVVLNRRGQKLSKQNRAAALDDRQAGRNLRQALAFLATPVPDSVVDVDDTIAYGIDHFDIRRLQAEASPTPAKRSPSERQDDIGRSVQ